MKKKLSVLLIVLFVCSLALSALGCTPDKKDLEVGSNGEILLATTTSTQDSGLLEVILPDFEAQTGIAVKVIAVGTGKAIEMGKAGEADVLLVHARSLEDQFIADGYGVERFDVMYNDFVVVGPKEDPAKVKTTAAADAAKALTAIAAVPSTFVSRDDKSGTHTKELAIWKAANITPDGDWYLKTGTGMGETLTLTNEKLGYTLADRATYANMKDTMANLEIVCEGDQILNNPYGVIAVSPSINDQINADGAQAFVDWIISPETQKLIGSYEVNGDPLFIPNAVKK
ncbi:substrate-binding domain-containing protein [uncultured Acetobacterium sp.]|uniref:substrate-binding domain-containing protein n=1 Tax=uncultured Acetobacterium sp. TaxID=217139 RepID=UPI0025F0EA9B|nr:substrate-binding domain-containing protein [uncultured Acetobacterium sp.]